MPSFKGPHKEPRELGSDLLSALADALAHNKAFLDDVHQAKPLFFRGTVTATGASAGVRQVQVQRTGQASSDGYWYPVYDAGYSPSVGDDVLLVYTDRRMSACVIGARTTGTGGTGTTTAHTSTSTRVRSLWNGTSNDAPPSGWTDVGYDDSAWAAATVAAPLGPGETAPAGTSPIWSSAAPLSGTEQCLFRLRFVLPAGAVSGARILLGLDDYIHGSGAGPTTATIWVNGTAASVDIGTPVQMQDGGGVTSTLPPGLFRPGGANVVALWLDNAAPSYAWLGALVSVSSGAPLANPGGSEGAVLYYHDGAWTDLPLGTAGQELTVVSGAPAWATPAAAGTVTSVALAGPTGTTVSGSPVTGAGTLTLSWASQTANTVLAAPNGSSGAPTFRALVAGDIPGLPASALTSGQLAQARGGTALDTSSVTDGQLLIGQSSDHSLGLATITAGTGITVTNAGHGITIAASGGGGSGTVTSVALTLPGFLSVSGSPITTSGTLAVTLANENANTVFAGPSSGSAAAPTFRALVAADLPAFSWTTKTANYTIATTDSCILADATSGGITVTLPTAVGATQGYVVKKKDSSSNTVTIATTSAQTIDGAATFVIRQQYLSITLASDGSNWFIA